MNNSHFNIIATTEINSQYFKHGMPIEYLLNWLKKVNKNLKRSINVNTKQIALGFENMSVSSVQPNEGESAPNENLVLGLNFPRVNFVLDSSQTESSKLLEEVNLAKAELTSVITDSAKIAHKISFKPLDTSELENAINQTQYPAKVRAMLGNMNGPKVDVVIDGETLTIGGYSFPNYCVDGEVQTFNSCEILKVIPRGQVIFDISRSKEFSLTDVAEQSIVSVDIQPETLDFSLLAFAFAAKLSLDIEVSFSKHAIKQNRKCSLVQILNQNQVSAEILRKWLEISQKLDIVG